MNEKQENAKETKKPDETKDTTRETTSEDTVIEEALIEEKKEGGMKPETKTALGALILVLFSLLCLWMSSTADTTTKKSHLVGIFLCISSVGTIISILVALFATSFMARNKDKRDLLFISVILLWCVFFLPLAIGIVPFSKYHNQNQIKRDTIISEAHLQIKALEDGIEILLPSEHASDNSYLEKVFSLGWSTDKKQAWENIMIPCREGDKYWYKVKLQFPLWYRSKLIGNPFSMMTEEEKEKYESNTDSILLFFNHVWKDYETTKEILLPDPNDPNSL